MLPRSQFVFPGSWAPDAQADMFAALGKNGQFINIVPSQRLVLVRMGDAPDTSLEVPTQFNNDIWKKLNEVIGTTTSVNQTGEATQFFLNQNYPNPFNPATVISFQLPLKSQTSLKIFDVLGRNVATVVNEVLPAGNYSRQWNAASVPSGVYFYRLTAGPFSETKKLLLVR
jgi:hypothetical protein